MKPLAGTTGDESSDAVALHRIASLIEQGSQGNLGCAAGLIAPKAAELAGNAIVRFDPVVDLLVVVDSEIVRTLLTGFSAGYQDVVGCCPAQIGNINVFLRGR